MLASQSWLILTQYYPPEIGAPQIRLRSLARELSRHGLKVEVLTGMPNYPAGRIQPGYAGRLRMRENIDNVPVRRVWIFAGTGKSPLVRLSNYFSFTFMSLIAALTGPRPDLMFVESQPLSLGIVALLMKWIRGVPYIYNVPDLQVDVAEQLGFMRNRLVLRLALTLENLFLRQSWKVATVTDRFIEHFRRRGIKDAQITFLPNGADTTFLRPLQPCAALIDRWQLHGKKVFLYVGTHAYYHGLDVLIDAAAKLRDCHDIVFLLIGDGPERQRLKEVVQDRALTNVVFGESGYEEMDRLYSIAYASIATLRDMEVARAMRLSKIFPALSCAVPVIYSGHGEAAEILVRKNCGIAVPPEQPQLLADSIARLASDPAQRDRMGREGRSLVESEFGWSRIVDNWLRQLECQEPQPSRLNESPAVSEEGLNPVRE